jgi:hypothetical protein
VRLSSRTGAHTCGSTVEPLVWRESVTDRGPVFGTGPQQFIASPARTRALEVAGYGLLQPYGANCGTQTRGLPRSWSWDDSGLEPHRKRA